MHVDFSARFSAPWPHASASDRNHCAVKRFAVDRCDGASAVTWQQFVESDVGEPDALQTTNLATPPTPATFLRLRILAGYKEFVTIRSFEAQLAS